MGNPVLSRNLVESLRPSVSPGLFIFIVFIVVTRREEARLMMTVLILPGGR
jgi:hypothetical protein